MDGFRVCGAAGDTLAGFSGTGAPRAHAGARAVFIGTCEAELADVCAIEPVRMMEAPVRAVEVPVQPASPRARMLAELAAIVRDTAPDWSFASLATLLRAHATQDVRDILASPAVGTHFAALLELLASEVALRDALKGAGR